MTRAHDHGDACKGQKHKHADAPAENLPGVARLHDLRIWAMSTSKIALTWHLVMPNGHPGDAFLMDASHMLVSRYRIDRATFQIEVAENSDCDLKPDDVI